MEYKALHDTICHNNEIEQKSVALNMSLLILALIAFCLAFLFKNSELCCVGIGISIIIINHGVDLYAKALAVFLLIFLNYLLYLGLTSFEFWYQVSYLLNIDDNLLAWLQSGHPHAIRLMIAYPGYLLQMIFDVDLNRGFGSYCTIIFTLFFLFLERIKKLFGTKLNAPYNDFALLFFVIFLFFIMNGRIAFAFLGYAILINEMTAFYMKKQRQKWFSRYIKIILGLILGTVSSGTMMVCICFTIMMFVITVVKDKTIGKGAIRLFSMGILGLPVIIYALSYINTMIDKNVSFFGGGFQGIINMLLHHGIGAIFGIPSALMTVWIVLMGLIFIGINLILLEYAYQKLQDVFSLVLSANVAFYGAFLGLSTGTLILTPLCMILLLALGKQVDKGYGNERKKHI